MLFRNIGVFTTALLSFAFAHAETELELEVFGKVKVVDEIDCTKTDHRFTEYPEGKSKVETILDRQCRVMPIMPEEASYIAWRIGEGKGLKANGSYVIVMEYPDDVPRAYITFNRGTDSKRAFCTGNCAIDCWNPKYVFNNPESFKFPQSGKFERWTCFTTLHDWTSDLNESRYLVWESEGVPKRSDNGDPVVESVQHHPEDGFDFAVVQYGRTHEPVSAGIAVSRILLCEIPNEEALYAKIQYPADGLPRRHIFWREEMADGGPLGDWNPQCADRMSWFRHKARQMKMLGMNTYCKDLLEFGHVQHWNPDVIRPGWAWGAATRWLWANVVPYMASQGFYILPYYEWCGNIGWEGANPPPIGLQKRATPLNRRDNTYTQIAWSEKADIDITDPEALEVTKELLYGTILYFTNQVPNFCGAFFRTRNTNWPVGFGDDTIARFRKEKYGMGGDDELFGDNANKAVTRKSKRPSFGDVIDADDLDGGGLAASGTNLQESEFGRKIDREALRRDHSLYNEYIRWWHRKRRDFLVELQKYLIEKGVPDAQIIFDSDCSEPGACMEDGGILTDDPEFWKATLAKPPFNDKDPRCVSLEESVTKHLYLNARRQPAATYKDYEWHHACPGDDPENYNKSTNVFLAMSINRMYSVSDPDAFKAYRNAAGVNTIIKHYPLNENMIYRYNPLNGEEARILGYSIHDTERPGRASMQCEVAAMATGNPVNLGYLIGSTFSRGFPGPVREFNLNFLALPAMSSQIVRNACQNSDVTLRVIDCKRKGKYYYLTYLGYTPAENVKVRFPQGTSVVHEIVRGIDHPVAADNTVTFDRLEPWQLISFYVKGTIGK